MPRAAPAHQRVTSSSRSWGDGLLASLPNRARARFRVGRFTEVDGATAVFALPNETHRSYCEEVRPEVEAALAARFGTAVPIRLVVDDEAADEPGSAQPTGPPARRRGAARASARPPPRRQRHRARAPPTSRPRCDRRRRPRQYHDDSPDLLDPAVLAAETELAGAGLTPEERLKQAFPGAEEV